MLSSELDTGLKEWNAVCQALGTGRQSMLLRKGGIHETDGCFRLEADEFVLFPTFLHQRGDWIKPSDVDQVDRIAADETALLNEEPATLRLSYAARVARIERVRDRQQVDALSDKHIYLSPLIDLRFSYKPHLPLYLVLLRVYRLPTVHTIGNTAAYAGCRSWVPLEQKISTTGCEPVLSDEQFQAAATSIFGG